MNLDAQWIVGFTDGEGCFHVGISKHSDMTLGVQVLPEFTIVQHVRDVKLLHAIKAFFGCGVVRKNHGDRMCWRVRKLEDLKTRIIPFFDQHVLKTLKRQDYLAFRKVVEAMSLGRHLNADGLDEIVKIAARMNRRRDLEDGFGKVKSSPS